MYIKWSIPNKNTFSIKPINQLLMCELLSAFGLIPLQTKIIELP